DGDDEHQVRDTRYTCRNETRAADAGRRVPGRIRRACVLRTIVCGQGARVWLAWGACHLRRREGSDAPPRVAHGSIPDSVGGVSSESLASAGGEKPSWYGPASYVGQLNGAPEP